MHSRSAGLRSWWGALALRLRGTHVQIQSSQTTWITFCLLVFVRSRRSRSYSVVRRLESDRAMSASTPVTLSPEDISRPSCGLAMRIQTRNDIQDKRRYLYSVQNPCNLDTLCSMLYYSTSGGDVQMMLARRVAASDLVASSRSRSFLCSSG